MPKHLCMFFALCISALVAAPIAAQEQQQVPDQPPSGIGQSVIAYPPVENVVDETLQDIEAQQLTAEQYRRLKEINLEKERQGASPYTTPPTPVTRTLMVNLDPGITPPVLTLAQNQLTTIVFSDLAGNPWSIESVALNRSSFTDNFQGQEPGAEARSSKQNILSIEPNSPAPYGNVTITLRGLPTPIIFMLTTAQKQVDMRVDAKIPGMNPDAPPNIGLAKLPSLDDKLGLFLDGVPPPESIKLKTSADSARAWLMDGNLYVKIHADALYPAYIGAARSTSGISIYRFAKFHRALTFTKGGEAFTVFLHQTEPTYD